MYQFESGSTIEMPIEDLRKTVDEKNTGNLPLNGIRHVDFIDRISECFDKRNITPNVEDVYIAANKSRTLPGVTVLPAFQEKYGEGAPETMLIRRLAGRLTFEDQSNENYNVALGFIFHQEGIQVAMGANVRVCSNMSILNSENYITTYGRNKVSLSQLFSLVENMADRYGTVASDNFSTLDSLKEIDLNEPKIERIVGDMTMKRVKSTIVSGSDLILNQGQISTFSKNILLSDSYKQDRSMSAYELYNVGTELMKGNKMDIPGLLEQNVALGNYFSNFVNN